MLQSVQYQCYAQDCVGSVYSELESFISSNKTLRRRLTEIFFVTGEGATEYVKLNYNLQIAVQPGYNNCMEHQFTVTYIWSESVLYLLGRDPLFYVTLFAVNVPEADETIELPCLCSTPTIFDLLNRLTYMVRAFHDHD